MAEYISTTEVQALTGIPEATLRYYRHKNTGPVSFRLGRRVVYRRSDVLTWIDSRIAATSRGDQS